MGKLKQYLGWGAAAMAWGKNLISPGVKAAAGSVTKGTVAAGLGLTAVGVTASSVSDGGTDHIHDPNPSALEKLLNLTDTGKRGAQRLAEVAELTEHFAGSYDAIMNPKKLWISIVSFMEPVFRFLKMDSWADAAKDYYTREQIVIKNFDAERIEAERAMAAEKGITGTDGFKPSNLVAGAALGYGAYRFGKSALGGGGNSTPNGSNGGGNNGGSGPRAPAGPQGPALKEAVTTPRDLTPNEIKRMQANTAKLDLDDLAKAKGPAIESGLKSAFMKGATRNIAGMAVLGGGLYVGSKYLGATEAQAQNLATDIIPGKDAYIKASEGDYAGAVESAAIDTAGFAGFIPGFVGGAKLGTMLGTMTGPFAVVAAPVGGFVGGLAGGIMTSGVASVAMDYAWDGGEYIWTKGADAVNYLWGDDEPEAKTEFNVVADNDNLGHGLTRTYTADNHNDPRLQSLAIGAP